MQKKILDNRYELERKIGEGGMARVYIGRDLRLNRTIAVKILYDRYVHDPDFLSRFRHEAQAAAILNHPNIVDVYDVGQDDDIHYIVMEYVAGTDLKKLINREAPLEIERAVAIAEEVARGMEAAHRLGMVHRDIKPQNIIIGDDDQVRVTDFGVAKSQLSTALTETGVTLGTVDYLSPEQAQGLTATPRSDVYALGVTLYEMLTGRLPFTGDTPIAVAMKHVRDDPPPPRYLNPQIPAQLEALILRAMAKDPVRRFASAQEFAEALRHYRNNARRDTLIQAGSGRPPVTPRVTGEPEPPPVRPQGQSTGTSGRVRTVPPPPRPAPARAPRQQGVGCGVFVVGMFVLAGVLGMVFLFSTGGFDWVFAGGTARPTVPTRVAPPGQPTFTPAPTETPTPTPLPLVRVPNLVNLEAGAAAALIEGLRLVPVSTSSFSDVVQRDRVIEQQVPAGAEIAEGQPVTYTVSLGPNLVAIPDLTQRPLEIARQQAEARGLVVEVVRQPNATVDEGFVFGQAPSPGLLVAPGTTVRIFVSVGDVVRFPDVIGLPLDQAEAILRATEGLELEYIDVQGPDRLPNFGELLPNQVLSATANGRPIANGDLVPRGSRIVIGVRAP